MDKLHGELAGPHGLPGLAGDELHLLVQAVLLQLEADKPGGHAGGVDGHVHIPHQIGNAADVVLVAVGDKDGPNAVPILNEVAEVGNDHVHPVHLVVWESHAHIHDDNVVAILIGGDVLSDLIETAQRDNFQFFCHKYSFTSNNLYLSCFMRIYGPVGTLPPGGPDRPPPLEMSVPGMHAVLPPKGQIVPLLGAGEKRRRPPHLSGPVSPDR